jgi:hypothetical protein
VIQGRGGEVKVEDEEEGMELYSSFDLFSCSSIFCRFEDGTSSDRPSPPPSPSHPHCHSPNIFEYGFMKTPG